jgi:hypothetical protein
MLRGERSSSVNATHLGLPAKVYLTPQSQDAPCRVPYHAGTVRALRGDACSSRVSPRGSSATRKIAAPIGRRASASGSSWARSWNKWSRLSGGMGRRSRDRLFGKEQRQDTISEGRPGQFHNFTGSIRDGAPAVEWEV